MALGEREDRQDWLTLSLAIFVSFAFLQNISAERGRYKDLVPPPSLMLIKERKQLAHITK